MAENLVGASTEMPPKPSKGRFVRSSSLLFSPVAATFLLWFLLLALYYTLPSRSGLRSSQSALNLVGDGAEMHRAFMAALNAMVLSAQAIVSLADPSSADKSTGKEALTQADMNSHMILTTAIGRSSLIPVISEEGVDGAAIPLLNRKSRLLMYVDPLDATQEYTERLTKYVSVAACITRCGRPVAGLVTFPFTGKTYVGIAGGRSNFFERFDSLQAAVAEVDALLPVASFEALIGPELDKECSDPPSSITSSIGDASAKVNPIRIIATRSHFRNVSRSDGWRNMHESIEALHHRRPGSELIRAGGSGFKIIEVIEDRADLYIHEGPIRKWDVCAGEAILRSKGGSITDYKGSEHYYGIPEVWWQATASGGGVKHGDGAPSETVKAASKTAFATTGIIASLDPLLASETLAVAARRSER